MAVTSTELKLTDAGQWTGDHSSEGNARKYTAAYEVQCDDKNDGPQVVLSTAAIPALYSTYAVGNDVDTEALCTKRTPRLVSRSQGGNIWAVECEFSTQATTNTSDSDPTQWLPKISGTYTQFTKALEADIDGNPIATAAGEVFDPVPEQDDSRPTLVVSKIFSSFDYVFFCDYRDKVNSDTWIVRGLAFGPDYLKVRTIGFQEIYINGASYYEVTANFEVNPEKWNPRKWLNAGYRANWPTASDSSKLILDRKTNLPVTSPQRLKADGTVEDDLSNPLVYVEYDTFERRPFSALNLN